ncbi:MAG TPA: S53 family serine peptidase [Terracidiphilus sp.]
MKLSLGRSALLFALLVSFGVGIGSAQTVLTHHTRDAVKDGSAKLVGHMPANQEMNLVIVLPLRNQDALEQSLHNLYDPASPSYRHFLTVDQFTQQFGPTQADYEAVIQFAHENGLTVTGTSRNRLNVDVSGSVANVEKAFNVELNVYQHPTEARNFHAPDREPTTYLPFSLWRVAGLDNYSIPHPAGLNKNPNAGHSISSATVGSGPSQSFLGSDMRAAYYGGTALTGSGQAVGLLEYAGTDLADVTTYFNNVHQTNSVPINLISTDGTSTSCLYSAGCDDTEQTLDITQALGMAPGLAKLDVYVGSTDSAMLNAMALGGDAQIGCSWAWSPADPSVDDPYFQEMAMQGQNFFVATGDSGKWPTFRSPYYYPAEDAYVTAVGGTDLSTSSAAGPWSSESAWADGGGGISPDHIAIPSWQTQTATSCSNCSKSYRNAPDVSANANFTFYVCADQTTCTANLYGGTSFAAPMWAGYMALVNQQSVAGGNGLVGFINPTLYSIGNSGNYPTDFHDITSGSDGYSATTGYDLATGWGSPNGANLINALSRPQAPGFSLSASPSSLSVAPGKAGNSQISFSATGGFGGSISLQASAPSGWPAITFSPTSISSSQTTSTMTVTVPSGATPGNYTITVQGTSGSLTGTTTVTVTVPAPAPVISLSATSTSITVSRGSKATDGIKVTLVSGTASPVTLSASGQEKNVSVSFSPNPVTPTGTSTMTVSANRKASRSTFNITITGTASGASPATTTVSVTVQ